MFAQSSNFIKNRTAIIAVGRSAEPPASMKRVSVHTLLIEIIRDCYSDVLGTRFDL